MVKDGFPINTISDIVSLPSFENVLPDAYYVDGMIFAVASAPEIPMPEQWMPWLIQSSDSHLVDKDVDKLADTLMNGLRAHLDFMRQEKSPMPNELNRCDRGARSDEAFERARKLAKRTFTRAQAIRTCVAKCVEPLGEASRKK